MILLNVPGGFSESAKKRINSFGRGGGLITIKEIKTIYKSIKS